MRFELTAWHEVKDNGKVMTVDEVIREINRLHEENLRLNTENDKLKTDVKKLEKFVIDNIKNEK